MFNVVGQSFLAFSEFTNLFLGDEKISFKELETEKELKLLQNSFAQADGIKLPLKYLKQGRAFVCFNSRLETQGGFALIDRGPYRCLEQIPERDNQAVEHSITELTAVCLTPGEFLRRTRYWSFVIGTTLNSSAQNIIYAVDTDKTALRERMFNHIRRHTLYEGPVKKMEGMSSESTEAVELTTKSKLTMGFLKLAAQELAKSVQRKQNLINPFPTQRLTTTDT